MEHASQGGTNLQFHAREVHHSLTLLSQARTFCRFVLETLPSNYLSSFLSFLFLSFRAGTSFILSDSYLKQTNKQTCTTWPTHSFTAVNKMVDQCRQIIFTNCCFEGITLGENFKEIKTPTDTSRPKTNLLVCLWVFSLWIAVCLSVYLFKVGISTDKIVCSKRSYMKEKKKVIR